MTLKKLVTGLSAAMISAAMISAAMAGTAMAGTWRTEAGKGPDGKTWYENNDGTFTASGWQWIDSDGDNYEERYYFDESGWLVKGTVTPDGERVNAKGQWTVNGAVQTREVSVEREVTEDEIVRFYQNAVFVGDSVIEDFNLYTMRSRDPICKEVLVLARASYSLHNAFMPVGGKSKHPLWKGQQMFIWDSLPQTGRKDIYLNFGLNDVDLGDDSPEKFVQLINQIRTTVPDAKFTVISMTYVLANKQSARMNNSRVRKFNESMKAICEQNGWGFIDVATPTSDGKGNLNPAFCYDNYMHHNSQSYDVWMTILRQYAADQLKYTKK